MTDVAGTSLDAFRAELDRLRADAAAALEDVADAAAVEAARIEFAGARSGRLKAVQKLLAGIPGPDKPTALHDGRPGRPSIPAGNTLIRLPGRVL